jgi:hypothetical protein
MKKIYINSINVILVFAFIILQGCEKGFLETQPTDSVSKIDVFESAESARGVLISVYRSWREPASLYAGLTYLHLSSDAKGPDFQKRVNYEQEIAYSAFNPEGGAVRYPWVLLYSSINRINDLLANLDGVSGTLDEIDKIRGEALAMRGFSYFELIRRYQHTYAIAKDMPGVPIYNQPTTAETQGNPRSSVSEVYAQILSDLTQAASLMNTARAQKGYFNINVVNAILARVYLTMEDWTNAIKYAQLARNGYPLMSAVQWQGGFMDIGNSEWIWGQNNSAEENQGQGSASAQMTPFAVAQWIWASDTLVSLYSDTDIRGKLIIRQNNQYNNFKFQMASPQYSGDYPYIRSAEMYLIEAEAMAKSGNDPGAQDALYVVQFRADPDAVKSVATGQVLTDEIILEKRKEFWGEGVYFFDMLRNQMPLKRDLTHQARLHFPANSWAFILPIPERELLINKSLDRTTDQNPLTGVYTGN